MQPWKLGPKAHYNTAAPAATVRMAPTSCHDCRCRYPNIAEGSPGNCAPNDDDDDDDDDDYAGDGDDVGGSGGQLGMP